jgi:ribonuclease P protein component
MVREFTFKKSERLKSRKLIEQLFSEGKRFHTGAYRVYFQQLPGNTVLAGKPVLGMQFGAGVSSKLFKHAVDRNRIKRLTREAWRLHKNELQLLVQQQNKLVLIFLIYTGKTLPEFNLVKETVNNAINELVKKLSK